MENKEQIEKALLIGIIDETINTGYISIQEINRKFNLKGLIPTRIIESLITYGLVENTLGSRPKKYLIDKEEWLTERTNLKNKLNIPKELEEECLRKYLRNNDTFRPLEEDEDTLLPEIIDFIVTNQQLSKAQLLSNFKLNYNRLDKIIEQLINRGIIDKNTHEILISKSKWIARKHEITK